MPRWAGNIGYGTDTEVERGLHSYIISEQFCYGDVYKSPVTTYRPSGGVNDNQTLNTKISILADQNLIANYANILYAEYFGIKWKVESVEPQYPRILLTLGGVYNGEQAGTADEAGGASRE